MDLLESLWTRTINTGGKRRALDKARQETLLVDNEMGGELVTHSYRAIESKTPFLNNNPVSPQAYGFNSSYTWRKPPPEICNLARNSYARSCFNDDRAREIFPKKKKIFGGTNGLWQIVFNPNGLHNFLSL